MSRILKIGVEMMDGDGLISSLIRVVDWDGPDSSRSRIIDFLVNEEFLRCQIVIEVSAKLRVDGEIGGFVRARSADEDLALWSFFCRLGMTESMGILVDRRYWLRVTLSNRKEISSRA